MSFYKDVEEIHTDGKHYYILKPENNNIKCPVVYAFHGLGGAQEWISPSQGNIKARMEDLVSKGSIFPMIMVMPIISSKKCSLSGTFDSYELANLICDPYFKYDLYGLVQYINEKYKEIVDSSPENSAITGYSMGATAAIYHAIKNDGMFRFIGGISLSKYVHLWIPEKEFIIHNNSGQAFNFIGFGENEDNEFKIEDKYCINCFENDVNKCTVTVKENDGSGHDFVTFNTLQDFFLERIFK